MTRLRNTISIGHLCLAAFLLASAGAGLGACAPAEPAAAAPPPEPPPDPPLDAAKIEEIVQSLGPDAQPICQEYVRMLCKQPGANVAACKQYADSVRDMPKDQATIACKAVVDAYHTQGH